jgi:hypothetical protein
MLETPCISPRAFKRTGRRNSTRECQRQPDPDLNPQYEGIKAKDVPSKLSGEDMDVTY